MLESVRQQVYNKLNRTDPSLQDTMSAKLVDEVPACLRVVGSLVNKDVYVAEGELTSHSSVVFKEEVEEHEGEPGDDEGGKNLL